MTAFLEALAWVTRFEFGRNGFALRATPPRAEQIVLARSAMALVIAAGAGLISWFVGDRLVSAFCGAAAAWALRIYLPGDRESNGSLLALGRVRDARGREVAVHENYADALRSVVIFFQPLCYFLLIYRGFWLWLLPALCLSTVIALEIQWGENLKREGAALPSHWLAAAGIVVLVCGFGSRLLPGQPGMFVLGLFGLVLAWLLPQAIASYWPKGAFRSEREALSAYYYLGEVSMLLLGMLGVAL
ncbi:MAG: hypothetical protein PHT80_10095 [Lentisphaeria bacterium]|nr:hypothetical protein [Lentisphaeria bacterium]